MGTGFRLVSLDKLKSRFGTRRRRHPLVAESASTPASTGTESRPVTQPIMIYPPSLCPPPLEHEHETDTDAHPPDQDPNTFTFPASLWVDHVLHTDEARMYRVRRVECYQTPSTSASTPASTSTSTPVLSPEPCREYLLVYLRPVRDGQWARSGAGRFTRRFRFGLGGIGGTEFREKSAKSGKGKAVKGELGDSEAVLRVEWTRSGGDDNDNDNESVHSDDHSSTHSDDTLTNTGSNIKPKPKPASASRSPIRITLIPPPPSSTQTHTLRTLAFRKARTAPSVTHLAVLLRTLGREGLYRVSEPESGSTSLRSRWFTRGVVDVLMEVFGGRVELGLGAGKNKGGKERANVGVDAEAMIRAYTHSWKEYESAHRQRSRGDEVPEAETTGGGYKAKGKWKRKQVKKTKKAEECDSFADMLRTMG
ncbi:hypothetical protein BJ138DRAFT_433806 [Hygrophoropsis aurantiaca]|uniref:Uncharacterized protein n=1 Tax=Hygrophoropsis aurantiaca TaxID=72124 RepID=A0ACB8AM22_9AGAM|nr:hypothetical protein BJ138DRAFT_433806 [Hygrophoropsis aurantiaca]